MTPTLSSSSRLPEVLVLWSLCKSVADALVRELKATFDGKYSFVTIADEAAGQRAAELSRQRIDSADFILMLAANEDWDRSESVNARDEFDYITTRIKERHLSRSSFSFVKYSGKDTPKFESANKIRPHFQNGKTLTADEAIEFNRFFSNVRPTHLPPVAQLLTGSEGEFLLLNRVVQLEDSLWTAAPKPAIEARDVLNRLKFLKCLHSVHAHPGPAITELIRVFINECPSQLKDFNSLQKGAATADYDFDDLRVSLHNTGAPSHLPSIRALIQGALIPTLGKQLSRMKELEESDQATSFMNDLLSRLGILAAPGTRRSVNHLWSDWVSGLNRCITLMQRAGSGFFISPLDIELWSKNPNDRYIKIVEQAQRLHVNALFAAAMIVVFFDLLCVHESFFECNEDRSVLVAILDKMSKQCEGRYLRQNHVVDEIVKDSNDLILRYLDVAEVLVK